MNAGSVILLGSEHTERGSAVAPWRPVTRAPLAPLPPGAYDRVLPFTPPRGADLSFYRGNFCGVRIPGAPWVPGAAQGNPSCVMACLLDHYPREIQDEFLRIYAGYYTHLQRSWGHALPNDGFVGVSIDQFVELSARAQAHGLFCDQWIIGGGALYNCNQPLAYWRPIIDDLCDALIANGVVDVACVGWQLDQLFGATPGNATIEVIAYVCERLPQSVPTFTHWMNEALAWWRVIGRHPDGSDIGEVWTDPKYWPHGIEVKDRFTWWYAMQPYLTGGHHQGNTTMARTDPKLYQDKLKDTLNPFNGDDGKGAMGRSRRGGRDVPFALTVFECTGQAQFDGAGNPANICSEDEGDQVGYILTCTTADYGSGGLAGYGNGARMPDGAVL